MERKRGGGQEKIKKQNVKKKNQFTEEWKIIFETASLYMKKKKKQKALNLF